MYIHIGGIVLVAPFFCSGKNRASHKLDLWGTTRLSLKTKRMHTLTDLELGLDLRAEEDDVTDDSDDLDEDEEDEEVGDTDDSEAL